MHLHPPQNNQFVSTGWVKKKGDLEKHGCLISELFLEWNHNYFLYSTIYFKLRFIKFRITIDQGLKKLKHENRLDVTGM